MDLEGLRRGGSGDKDQLVLLRSSSVGMLFQNLPIE